MLWIPLLYKYQSPDAKIFPPFALSTIPQTFTVSAMGTSCQNFFSSPLYVREFFLGRSADQRLVYWPHKNHKGVGATLINHLEKIVSEQGANMLTVRSTLNAVEFCRKSGFDLLEIVKHQVSDQVHLQCRKMIKNLMDWPYRWPKLYGLRWPL